MSVPTWNLSVAEPYRRTFRAILDRPERIFVAWHRDARGVCELLDEAGRDKYGVPQESLWEVCAYKRTVLCPDSAYYELEQA